MARLRQAEPVATGSAEPFVPPNPTLPRLREAALTCRGCGLWVNAAQTVFGEGVSSADLMFVGEPPGDLEDRTGHPFVGPAGKLLHSAMLEAGLDRSRVYLTNSVKHFKFVMIERGRRLHQKPNTAEIRACHPWLREEIRLVKPRVVVALGATAAQALLGKQFRVTHERGKPMSTKLAGTVIATVHPSSVLRTPDGKRERARREFVADLRRVAYLRRPKAKVTGSR